ncbi:MAG TPA: ester cyclase [Vicinamibacterales bacterium]|nr:ester cyclase [Vicinamibacterales bacterium]
MTRAAIVSFFEERQSDWTARNPDRLADGHAEHGTIVSPMFGRRVGRNAIRESYRALFETFPDWTFASEPVLVDDQHVAQPFSATATHVGDFMGLAGTNRRFKIQGVRLFDMDGGKIQHERRYYDFTGFLIQVGVLRGKPAKE